jgi:membrane protein YdbS with pleckstrin-like domain
MAYPDNLLSRGERVVLHKHPHWKMLVLPVVFFIVAIGGGAAFAAWVSHWRDAGFTSHLAWYIALGVVAGLILIFLVLVPVLRWATEHFVISTGHVFFRTGILKRRAHQIPLARIQNMETEVGFWGRILGYGSLIVESAADQPLEFENVASLPKVQATLNQLISDDRGGSSMESDAGDGSAGDSTVSAADTGRPRQLDDRPQTAPRRARKPRTGVSIQPYDRPDAENPGADNQGADDQYAGNQKAEHATDRSGNIRGASPAGQGAVPVREERSQAGPAQGQGEANDDIVYQQYADAEYGQRGQDRPVGDRRAVDEPRSAGSSMHPETGETRDDDRRRR